MIAYRKKGMGTTVSGKEGFQYIFNYLIYNFQGKVQFSITKL